MSTGAVVAVVGVVALAGIGAFVFVSSQKKAAEKRKTSSSASTAEKIIATAAMALPTGAAIASLWA